MDELSSSAPTVLPVAPDPESAKPAPAAAATPVPLVPTPEHMRRYESLLLLPSRFEGEALETFNQSITALLSSQGALNILPQNLGRRALAYPIKEQKDGVYMNFVYHAAPAAIAPIDRALRLNETVVRFLTTTEEG